VRGAAAGGYRALEADLRLLARRARLVIDIPDEGSDDGRREAGTHAPAPPLGLTEREVEVLRLVAAGLTNREIGERLFISPKTASVHVSAILGKLGVDGRLEAALVAQQLGLVDGDPVRP
jgi:DNA-binding NarL/FixJ family response regulator